ncbi:hypothetical protein JR316_0009189 [Psilocybe cubensis]|uniref:Transmembrane protein n=2 Tax=Psilocybe cubensis TaxID=181762 RepID=A0A8H7XUW8_PSICU|nr:hypothetical protein JR316_0009189 [Psilocybe cubensis]KAH9478729.1 hypothetical protein JR316_0009189 [Psilocybe cubensis]
MVDWMSPAEIAKDAVAFDRFMHALLGLYMWEFAISIQFDWQYISGKKTFRWPMIFYFLNRYCLLFALIGIAIALNVTEEVNCQGLYTFNQCFGNAAIGLASINLSLRTIAVWSRKWYIIAPLVLVILGHWSLLLHGILLKAAWVPGQGCVITQTDNKLLAATFIYTMVFDLSVLILTAFKLFSPKNGKSKLVGLIFNDGLIYFMIAFMANLIATIFMLLNLNPVMSIIANVPAAIASTIVACRVVRRLSNYTSRGAEMFPTTTQGSTIAFRSNMSTHRPKAATKVNTKVSTKSEGVHVQMETFESPTDKTSYVEYDASGKMGSADSYDPESQVISGEFKRPPY